MTPNKIFIISILLQLGQTKPTPNRYLSSRRRRFYHVRNLDNFIDLGFGQARSNSVGDSNVGKKLYNDAYKATLVIGTGTKPSIQQNEKNEYTILDIQSVGFENGAVIVTIRGIKSGKFLAAAGRGSKVFLTSDKRQNIRWRLEVDQNTKQDRYKNTKSGRYLAFGRSKSPRPIQRRSVGHDKNKSEMQFLQLISRL